MTLTNNQQAEIVWISGALIAIGAISVPIGAPWYVGLIIAAIGVAGIGLKELPGASISGAQNFLTSGQLSALVQILVSEGLIDPAKTQQVLALITQILQALQNTTKS